MVDFPTNGTNGGATAGGTTSSAQQQAQNIREYAEDAQENLEQALERAKAFVLKYPMASVAGAVAAGFFFARFVARRR